MKNISYLLKNKFLVFILIFIQGTSNAQEVPRVIHFSDENILNDQVWSMTQAQDKRMYFGTSNGMISFNGCDWNVLDSSQNNIIRAVAADDDGKIYMGSYDEFGYWQRNASDELQYTSLSKKTPQQKGTKEEIWHILLAKQKIYFQSFSTIFKYDKEKIDEISTPGNIMFLQSVRNQLFLQKIGGGIYELEESDNFRLLQGTDFFSDKKIVFILPFGKEGLLVGTEQHGIFIWEKNQVKPWFIPLQNEFLKNQLNKGIQLSSGDYVFGTILNGVYILNSKGQLKSHLTKQTGLPDNTILSIMESDNGNLWLGLDRGIVLVDLRNPLLFFKDTEGNLGTVYTASFFDKQFYLGTNHGVFYRKENRGENEISKNNFQFVEGTQGQVWDFRKTNNELLCGHNEGTFSIANGRAEKISITNGGWAMSIFPDDGNLLLQGTYSGLVFFKKNNLGKWIFSHRVNGFLEPVKEMVIDDSGGIWLAHPIEGLQRVFLDSSKTEIRDIYKFTNADGLPSNKMINLLWDEKNVFAKSGDQWVRFDKKTKRFSQEGKIRNHDIKNIEGKIILNENGSWFEILPTQVHFFSKNLPNNPSHKKGTFPIALVEGYENIVCLDSLKYWFCLKDGYAILDTKNFKANDLEDFPAININQLEILTEDSSTLVSTEVANLKLKNYQNRLRFHFYQPGFDYVPTFRCRMEGLENKWSAWTTKSDKEYFNLPPGEYTFWVESEFSIQPVSFTFRISPHWSKTPLAYSLYFLGFLALVWWIQIFQKRKYIKAKLKLEAEQKRQLHEQQMEAENEKLQLDVLNKSKQLANSAINLAQKNEILLKIKTELKELKNSSGVQIPGKEFQQLLHVIDIHLTSEADWELFEKNFTQVHEQFFKKLKMEFPELTPADLQLAAYLKMNLTSKEIAPLFHISLRGVENKRYRLRKKLGLSKDANLTEIMMKY